MRTATGTRDVVASGEELADAGMRTCLFTVDGGMATRCQGTRWNSADKLRAHARASARSWSGAGISLPHPAANLLQVVRIHAVKRCECIGVHIQHGAQAAGGIEHGDDDF